MASHAPGFGRASALPLAAVLSSARSYPRPVIERLVARLIDHLDGQDAPAEDLEQDDEPEDSADAEPCESIQAMGGLSMTQLQAVFVRLGAVGVVVALACNLPPLASISPLATGPCHAPRLAGALSCLTPSALWHRRIKSQGEIIELIMFAALPFVFRTPLRVRDGRASAEPMHRVWFCGRHRRTRELRSAAAPSKSGETSNSAWRRRARL